MSGNASSSSCDSPPHLDSSLLVWLCCLLVEPRNVVFTTFVVTNTILHLPLSTFILYHGLRRWRHLLSAAPATPSDSFTYHLVAMELICAGGYIGCCCGIYRNNLQVFEVGYYCTAFTWYGLTFFHLLTSLEHYLAVIHPIVYLSLREQRGTRIRNVTTGCIWLLCVGGTIVELNDDLALKVSLALLFVSLIVTSFCSLSVLRALFRPGPGGQSQDRERVDQSKLRAFYTIVAILGVISLRLTWNLVWTLDSLLIDDIDNCYWITCDGWVNLPSSLVLPLLFLQRTLVSCKNTK